VGITRGAEDGHEVAKVFADGLWRKGLLKDHIEPHVWFW
jgi:hypothetical protein